jgi:hypothetical protein
MRMGFAWTISVLLLYLLARHSVFASLSCTDPLAGPPLLLLQAFKRTLV